MSLFKVRNWWKTQCPAVEPAYDSFSLHCARLCIEEGEKDSIVVGSHTGQLCIYQPSGGKPELPDLDGEESGQQEQPALDVNSDAFENVFQHSDVILEVRLPFPVIGVTSGKFTTAGKNDTRLQLAVLHPMKLSIYQIVTVDGIAEHGDHTKLVPLYDHPLTRPAFSLCHGPFGGVKGREFLCVQHLDGSLRFFEQDGISFERSLANDRHIPSPVHYLPRVDCFVTVAPSWTLECFRYQDISEPIEELRRHDPIWSLCVGEYALDVNVHQISNSESVIVVLGENNLVCVTDTGKVRFIKKLDYSPVCFHTFVVGWYWEPGARLILSVVSESGSLLLYENDQIIWSAQLPDVPVAIGRANVAGLPGALVTLGPTGALMVGYLGSEPQLFKVPALNLAPFEIARCQRELLELEREIRTGVDPSDASIANAAAERDVTVQLELAEATITGCTHPTDIPNASSVPIEMCQLSVTVRAELNLEMLQVTVATDRAVRCTKDSFLFRDVVAHSTESLQAWIYPGEPAIPGSLTVAVFCSYTNKQGITRVLQRDAQLPLRLFVKGCQPSKEAQHKVTLSLAGGTGSAVGTLGHHFPEFLSEGTSGGPSALGLQSLTVGDGRRVTIVAAKNTNRFRVQSDDLALLCLGLDCLVRRLSEGGGVVRPPKVILGGVPSVNELLKVFQTHHELRKELKRLETELETTTGQMRLFERRFVVKLQERSLRALDGTLMLLKRNHSAVAKACQQLKSARQQVKLSQIHMTAVLHLFGLCYSHSANVPGGGKYLECLRGLLTSTVIDSTEQSYEEMLLPVVRFLDQTGPLRKSTSTPGPSGDNDGVIDDALDEATLYGTVGETDPTVCHDLLRRHLVRVLGRVNDRMASGAKAAPGSGRNSVDFEDESLPEAHNEDGEEEEENEGEQDKAAEPIPGSPSLKIGSSVSEWVNYEKVSDLPM
ncbi:protein PTHB1 [Anopheles ziemanni]|uniref:protein PTHB1 n=1 Tax=Anopheles coustani TaxID=139045 RepID=UPI00265B1EE5|nr:protein PTHB1 [Anopheles coustani]XP_058167218.1 protein PTHB1 [Anopheles ziemanni]